MLHAVALPPVSLKSGCASYTSILARGLFVCFLDEDQGYLLRMTGDETRQSSESAYCRVEETKGRDGRFHTLGLALGGSRPARILIDGAARGRSFSCCLERRHDLREARGVRQSVPSCVHPQMNMRRRRRRGRE